jgi:outer membrane autotransporter protein
VGRTRTRVADIDGFSSGGNKVSFDDDSNVRGRLGLRVGTSMQVWTGTTMEPFVIGSLWGNLSDDNKVTLVSSGTTFRLEDDLDDVWGEVSAGVNFFNPSEAAALRAASASASATPRMRACNKKAPAGADALA